MDSNQSLGILVAILVVLILIFLVIRMFWLWYWRINDSIRLLTEIRDGIRGLNQRYDAERAATTLPQDQPAVSPAVPDARILIPRKLQLRREPRSDANVASSALRGTSVTVVRTDRGWALVQTESGQEGWTELPIDR